VSDQQDKQPVLTDEEIEALVDHASTGGGFDDGQFRSHDFGAGEALTLARWTDLEGLLRAHAEALEALFDHSFSLEVTVEPFAPLYTTVRDLLPAMPERLVLISTDIGPLEGESHLEFPGAMLSFLVNQYFGGGGMETPTMSGKVTPSEQRLGERLGKDVLRTMTEIWADRLSIAPGDLYIDITPDRLALTPGDVGYVVLTFRVTAGELFEGDFRIMLPFEGLEPYQATLKPRVRQAEEAVHEPEWETRLQKAIPDISVEVSGVMTQIETTVRNLLAMRVGMVIPIPEPEQIRLTVDDRSLARGGYGAHEGNRAVQITQFEGHIS